MWTVYLIMAVTFLVIVFCCISSGILPRKPISALLGALVATAFAGLMGALFAIILGAFFPKADYVYGPAKMVAMRSTDGISGSFILASGRFSDVEKYNFYWVDQDNSIVPGNVSAADPVHIIEDPSLHGVGYWTVTESEVDHRYAHWVVNTDGYKTVVREQFRVPVGTVVQDFKISQ